MRIRRIVTLSLAFALPWLVAWAAFAGWEQSEKSAAEQKAKDPTRIARSTADAERMATRSVEFRATQLAARPTWTPSIVLPQPVVVSAQGSGHPVYLGPSINTMQIERLEPSTKLTVLANEAGWYLVRLPDGREGYVKDYIVVAPEPPGPSVIPMPEVTHSPRFAPTPGVPRGEFPERQGRHELGSGLVVVDQAFVRSGPSVNASIVAEVRLGTKLSVVERQGAWWQVRQFGWLDGFIRSADVVLIIDRGGTPVPVPTPGSEPLPLAMRIDAATRQTSEENSR